MSGKGRFTLFVLALASVGVLAVPALAQAAPSIELAGGGLVPVGTSLHLLGVGAEMPQTVHCSSVEAAVEVTRNNGSEVSAVPVGEGSGRECAFATTRAS